ncbi:histidinol dehydrogenase [Candidatus Endolissoclinum faulkneri L2]|uniref:Histidinol dehydrogenase n=1 Tax=Candidatus Endolissoclinum faulkneri L2 TaxID=1193729 RepID=K7YPL5_9PROT|nr:histidinol dehydrogenase [Candidatus Endolissoclinum faulkneri]AFX98509.1 histidinol dehydrogenase [Candidatus Endolissoclinum faulkneri L2]
MSCRLVTSDTNFASAFDVLINRKSINKYYINEIVTRIIAAVIDTGDSALVEYTRRFDLFDPIKTGLSIGNAEINAAVARVDSDTQKSLELAAERIENFHRRQLPKDFEINERLGIRIGMRWSAIDSVGLYVPGGTATYSSSVLMNALPAKIAGVPRRVMMVPTPDGVVNDLVLAAAHIAGVNEIWRIGGAQAIAALAYGTQTITRVDKIVGPGNAYVAAAKQHVFGKVGIDSLAGPSEILVVADSQNNPHWIAIDLLSQAEHDPLAQAILITDDNAFANAVADAVEDHLVTLPRVEIAEKSWRVYGAIIVTESIEEIPEIVNRIAPEHLELAVADPESMAVQIRHAGAIFLGRFTPVAIGDYLAGPNHVLPTAGTARFSSALSVFDFMKYTTTVASDPQGLAYLGPATIKLAEMEGLNAHARSLAIRINQR